MGGVGSAPELGPKPPLLPCQPHPPAAQLWHKNNRNTRQTKSKQRPSNLAETEEIPLKTKQIKINVNFDGSHGDVIWKAELGLCWEVQLS